MKEFLSWLVLCGGTVILGCIVAVIIAWIERRRERSRDIYYIYMTHMEKSSDVHRRQK